jgi:DNA polymerase zeta
VFTNLAKKLASNVYEYAKSPPSASLLATIEEYDLPEKIYRDPYYSKAEDASDVPWEFAGLTYHLKGGDGLNVLEEWGSSLRSTPRERNLFLDWFDNVVTGGWEYAQSPPSVREVRVWLDSEAGRLTAHGRYTSRSQVRFHIASLHLRANRGEMYLLAD